MDSRSNGAEKPEYLIQPRCSRNDAVAVWTREREPIDDPPLESLTCVIGGGLNRSQASRERRYERWGDSPNSYRQ